MIFPIFIKAKRHFLPIPIIFYRNIKKTKCHFLLISSRIIWFCLNQHENIFFPRFLMSWSDLIWFVWISMKNSFFTICDDFSQFLYKKQKSFSPISSRIDLTLSESTWKRAFLTISDDFSQFHKKAKNLFFQFPAELNGFYPNQY